MWLFLGALVWLAGRCAGSGGPLSEPKVLVILADGSRWDYPDDGHSPGFTRMAEEGVRAQYTVPAFPANSYPNWYTLVTGLYPESHGFIENHMYDPLYDDMFLMAPQESLPHWWQQAEPIWVTAERSGAKVAMFWWDGCQISIRGERPTSCLQYRSSIGAPEIRATLLSSVARLQAGEFQMAMVYVENVDHAGHVYGPNSPERIQAWRELDSAIYDTLESAPSDITVIVLADHGMADRANLTFIEISRAVDANDIKLMLYGGATAGLIPKNGRRDKVYQDLVNARFPGLKFFKKEDIPERYHIKHNRLTPPIVLIADKGYSIMSFADVRKGTAPPNLNRKGGSHGWDPQQEKDMRAIFYARGPALKKKYLSAPIENVDPYNLICSLLNINPLPNNGSWARIQGMYERQYFTAGASMISFSILCALASIFGIWSSCILLS